jgi:AhpD family alkylhydroperoxidase
VAGRLASNRSVSVSSVTVTFFPVGVVMTVDVRRSGGVTQQDQEDTMKSRMNHPAIAVPGAMDALQALGAAVAETGLDPALVELICLRASQINGCSVCVDGHPRVARRLGETDERLFAVSAWRDTPYFSDAERAALALTEAVTRLPDREDPVPDHIWSAAATHYNDKQLAGRAGHRQHQHWNRLNTATAKSPEPGSPNRSYPTTPASPRTGVLCEVRPPASARYERLMLQTAPPRPGSVTERDIAATGTPPTCSTTGKNRPGRRHPHAMPPVPAGVAE